MGRVEKVREFRANSVAAGTRKFAATPTLFCQIAQPDTDYIVVPKVSSERRNYIPIGFLTSESISSDLLFSYCRYESTISVLDSMDIHL